MSLKNTSVRVAPETEEAVIEKAWREHRVRSWQGAVDLALERFLAQSATQPGITDSLQRDAWKKGAELGLADWQDIVRAALEAWVRPPVAPASGSDPRIDRLVSFLEIPGNFAKLEELLQAIVRKS